MTKISDDSIIVSSETPDWSREYKAFFQWAPSRSLMASIRDYQKFSLSSNIVIRVILRKVAVLRYRFWTVITGTDIPLNCHIEGGLLIPHPNGIVIHPEVKIGPNCLIFQQVTIGKKGELGPPSIGGHVDIGAGAKILGNIKIGDHASIGANAVVMQDVPAGKTAVGIPAKILD